MSQLDVSERTESERVCDCGCGKRCEGIVGVEVQVEIQNAEARSAALGSLGDRQAVDLARMLPRYHEFGWV